MEVKKERRVSALENGTVIDHLPPGTVLKIARILDVDGTDKIVTIGMNLYSKKFSHNKKDIIKLENRYLSKLESDKLALIAKGATVSVIKNWEVTNKVIVNIPDIVYGIKCANPRCITRHDNIKTKFDVTDKVKLKVRCHYCEHEFERDELIKHI